MLIKRTSVLVPVAIPVCLTSIWSLRERVIIPVGRRRLTADCLVRPQVSDLGVLAEALTTAVSRSPGKENTGPNGYSDTIQSDNPATVTVLGHFFGFPTLSLQTIRRVHGNFTMSS